MKADEMNSPVAKVIIDVLAERHDRIYVEEKKERLRSLETAHALLWCHCLDGANQAAVSARLGLSPRELQTAISLMRKVLG